MCGEELLSQLRQLVERGQVESSLRALEAEAGHCSQSAKYHALLSLVLKNKGDLANAAKEMNAAINLEPQQPDFVFQLAQILFDNGDLGGARLLLVQIGRASCRERVCLYV